MSIDGQPTDHLQGRFQYLVHVVALKEESTSERNNTQQQDLRAALQILKYNYDEQKKFDICGDYFKTKKDKEAKLENVNDFNRPLLKLFKTRVFWLNNNLTNVHSK